MKFFEDVRIGDANDFGSHTFTAEDIAAFAARYDPQPLGPIPSARLRASSTLYASEGGVASGWHVACVWMGMMVRARAAEDAERRARGEGVAELGPSPGFRDLKWLAPVQAGDTVSYRSEVIEARVLGHRPGWGIMVARTTGVNQHGEPVISFTSSVFVERRGKGMQS
jgi:acyl dehydratase